MNPPTLSNMDDDKPEVVTQKTPQDIVSHFKRFMDDQDRLSEEVEKIARSLAEEKLIEIVRICSNQNENKKSGYNRLCGTLLLWKKKEKPSFSVEKFAEQNFGHKGTRINDYRKIVNCWDQIQIWAKEKGQNAYNMSFYALEKLYNANLEGEQRTKLQWILAKLGSKEGFNSWIPLKDRTKTHEGQSLGSLSLEKLPSSGKYGEIEKNIKLIDVIWLENDRIFQIFKIGFNKNKENFSSKFIEIADFSILTKIPFNLVVNESLGKKVEKELLRPTFKEIRLSNRCFIMTAIKDWEEAWEKQNFEKSKKK